MTKNQQDEATDHKDSDERRVGLLGNFRPDAAEHIALIQEMRTQKNPLVNRILWIASAAVIILIFAGLVWRISK